MGAPGEGTRGGRGCLVAGLLCLALAAAAFGILPESRTIAPPVTVEETGAPVEVRPAASAGLALALLAAFAFVAARFAPRGSVSPGGRERVGPAGGGRGAFLAIVAAGALARLPGLGSGLWFDEIWMLVDFARRPLGELWLLFGSDNNHPLYSLCARLAVLAFGEHPWSLRLPAWLFGVAGLLAFAELARSIAPRREALLVTALLALSPHHVSFSQSARGYTGLFLFAVVSTHAFLRAMRTGAARDWGVHGIALALSTWVHLTGLFLAAGQLLGWIVLCVAPGRREGEVRREAPFWGFLLGGALSLAVHLPILPQMVDFLLRGGSGRERVESEWTSPVWAVEQAAASIGAPLPLFVLAALVALVFVAAGLASWWRRERAIALFAVLPAAVTAAALLGLHRNLWPRFFFFLGGLWLLVVARGLFTVLGRRVATAVLALALLASIPLLAALWRLPQQDFEGAMERVATEREPGEPVLTVGLARFPYDAYHETDYRPIESVAELERALAETGSALVLSTLDEYVRSRQPSLWSALEARGDPVASLPGRIGGGEVRLSRVR